MPDTPRTQDPSAAEAAMQDEILQTSAASPETAQKTEAEQSTTDDSPPQSPEALAELLQAAEKKAAEYYDALLRAKAESENIRRRAQEDVAKAGKFAAEKFAGSMLPVKDSLEAALNTENQSLENLTEGVQLTLKQLISAFEGANIREENPLQQKFDPNLHQAISAIPADAEPNTVVTVLQKGYVLHERVLRPAMVMVAQGK